MIVRRANQRRHRRRQATHSWHTFGGLPQRRASGDGFGVLNGLDEYRLAKGADVPRQPRRDAELLTYVHEGAIGFVDADGQPGVLQTGEFQRLSLNRRDRQIESNASNVDVAHFFQFDLRASEPTLVRGQEHKRFSVAERKRTLCTIASPDGRAGSLLLEQDSFFYSVLLAVGQHVAHELRPGRSAWVHVVAGEVSVGDTVLSTGDGAGITAERALSITALGTCELLIVDLTRPASARRPSKAARR